MAFKVPSLTELQKLSKIAVQQAMAKGKPIVKTTIEYGLGQAIAAVVYLLLEALRTVWEQLWPDTATGRWLDRHAGIWGLSRKDIVSARGNVKITGTDATVLPAGSTFEREDGATFTTIEEVQIVLGEAIVIVVADVAGQAGNTSAGAEFTLTDAVAGIDDTATVLVGGGGEDGLVGGLDLETDDDLRVRLLLRISDPPKGGSLSDYVQWALEVPGITRAWAVADVYGPGTIVVLVVNDNADPITPDADKLEEVVEYLTNEDDGPAPATDTVYAESPDLVVVDLEIELFPFEDAVKDNVTAKLAAFFKQRAPNTVIHLSNLSEVISSAAGEEWHTLIDPVAPVEPGETEIPVLGTITYTEP